MRESPPRDGDQLRLALFVDVAWDGRSPRVLTKGFIPLFLRRKPPPHEVFFDEDQLELWPIERPHRKKSPDRVVSVGAPSLFDRLNREV